MKGQGCDYVVLIKADVDADFVATGGVFFTVGVLRILEVSEVVGMFVVVENLLAVE